MVLLPLALTLPLLGVLLAWGNAAFDRLLITKVRSDLAVAQGYFDHVLDALDAGTAAVAQSHALHLALERAQDAELVGVLRDFKTRRQMDFINLRAPDGTLRSSDSAAPVPAHAPRLSAAEEQDRASVEVLAPEQLALLGPALRARVVVPLVATPNAAPTERTQEERAMVLLSTHAIRAADGRLLGWVQGGRLMNRNLRLIDQINEIVYPKGSLPFGSEGTATLFLDDVRISTNVRLFGAEAEQRAIGTRVSQTVREAVLGRGETWLDRAFVVNEWYVSAYQPLHDGTGRRIGMLYVGYRDRPFALVRHGVLAAIAVTFLAVMALATLIALRWARSIFGPLEQMASTMGRVQAGALEARVGAVRSRDEIGQLAGHLDRLLDAVDEKTRALERWNVELDAKVAERTRQLESAQTRLVRSEKLAAIGQLTAGVAHEVNNPIAVIQGNVDLLRLRLGPEAAAKLRPELRLIDEQVERMRMIVTRMLQFARPNEFAGYVEDVQPGGVLDDCLVLVRHLMATARIVVERDFASTRSAAINRQELQQVLVNLLVNAIHAMPDGGTLSLSTRDWEDEGVEIGVADSGHGLSSEVLRGLFQPFETHKKDGTGLGLWISRSIVERYGGDMQARNRPDGRSGALFCVRLKSRL
jgi:signal transduction histidine kinase